MAESDEWRETDEVWLVIAEWDAEAIPDDEASWAGNFWYLCEAT